MGTVSLQEITGYLDSYLRIAVIKDYPGAWNGLQVEGRSEVSRIAAAVDASVATVEEAGRRNVDLLLTHHGLFWNSSRPLVGRDLRRIAPLIRHEISVYSAHLPLDCHPEVGNNALLLRRIGLEPVGRFGKSQRSLISFRGPEALLRGAAAARERHVARDPATKYWPRMKPLTMNRRRVEGRSCPYRRTFTVTLGAFAAA
ncbi:MAG TPA: Nif3-like dinuclear metal center hexameric protein [Armatimonadota bacterium]|nr:Nif3-like dinuclear metal center hexameric protein [Armatimonadota bacterium]